MSPDLVVLAAGRGSRFGGPKQLAPVGPAGETLLEYSIFDAVRAGFGRVILVVRRETEGAFRDRFAAGMARHVRVDYVHQRIDDVPDGFVVPAARDKPWGTGHAVLAAEAEIERPFAVINADDFYGASSFAALGGFLEGLRDDSLLAAVGFRLADTLTDSGPVTRAVLEIDGRGRLQRATELPEVWRDGDRILYRAAAGPRELRGQELVSMNMWGFTPALLPRMRRELDEFLARRGRIEGAEFLLPEAVQSLVDGGRFQVQVLRGAGDWCGLTFQQDHQRVRSIVSSLIQRGRYPEKLWG